MKKLKKSEPDPCCREVARFVENRGLIPIPSVLALCYLISALLVGPLAAQAPLPGLSPQPGGGDTAQRTEIFTLRHQPAAQVVPVIKPFIEPGGTATGMNNQVIIKATAEQMEAIRAVIAEIDRPLRRLRIAVRQTVSAATAAHDAAVGAAVSAGAEGDRSEVRVRSLGTRTRDEADSVHFVQALEGQAAFIQTGQAVPVANRTIARDRYGAIVEDGIEYRDVGSGFYVTPRLNGDTVTLALSPYTQRLSRGAGGVIEQQGADTVVSGKLGAWIPIGGAAEDGRGAQDAILARTRRSGATSYGVEVKVEEITQ
jgi:type II secretory pathway component GspD/PulD (secretin)